MFLHDCKYDPLETEHPCQGSLPDLKLDWQPPTQLPVALASLASFADIESDAVDGVRVATDVGPETALRATVRCSDFCGLATCFGASTTTLGSDVLAPAGVVVCDSAVPIRPHGSEIDEIATVRLAAKRNEAFMVLSSQKAGTPSRACTLAYIEPLGNTAECAMPVRLARNELSESSACVQFQRG
jgi:hypothetical protein